MLTALIIVVMLLIGFGLAALYREVGLGRGKAAPSAPSGWPFGNLAVGDDLTALPEDGFSGFLAICSDDVDALGELYSVAVVAEEWGYPLSVAIARTIQPIGWTDRLDGLPGNVTQHEMSIDAIGALAPVGLPVVVFLNDRRVLDASTALDSPSAIATSFQHCRFGLTR
jgi:hypothetical protein